jgi:rod shape-determining protein MreC
VSDAFSGVTGYGDLEDENAELRARLAELEGAELQSEEAERELRQLQELLDVDWVGDIPSVGARVVTTPVSNYEQTIELDKGTEDGVEEGMPVVTGSGLAGQVVSASDRRATVRLVTDPDSRIAVRLRTSGDLGLVTGEGPDEPLSVDFVEPGTEVHAAELLTTSGLEGAVLPGGIPVGRVVERAQGDLEQSVDIRAVADLEHLELVRVLQWTPPPGS